MVMAIGTAGDTRLDWLVLAVILGSGDVVYVGGGGGSYPHFRVGLP